MIESLVKKWEKLDNHLFKKKDKKFKVVKFKKRTLISKYGDITYNRRIYYYYNTEKNKKEYICLLDEKLKIPKYQHFSPEVFLHIEKYIGDGKRYRDIRDTLNIKISLMTISNVFKNAKIKNENSEKIKLENNQKLYINIDDCFLKGRYNGKVEDYKKLDHYPLILG